MTRPINLNTYRKAKKRADDKARADSNATKFGRTKAQRALDAAQSDRLRQALNAHKFDDNV
jgi:hypothetical protein